MAPGPGPKAGLLGRLDGRLATSLLFFVSPLLSAAIPRLTWLFLPLIGVALILPALRHCSGWRALLAPDAYWTPFFLLAFYLFLNTTWAADQPFALGSAAVFLGVSLIVCAASRSVAYLPQTLLHRAALAFAIGAFLGAFYLLFELLTDASIVRMALNAIDLLQRNAKHMVIFRGEVIEVKRSILDRNAAIVMFSLWPVLLVLTNLESRRRQLILGSAFFALAAVTILLSEHDSSKVALIFSPLVFICAWFWPRATVVGLAAAWCLAFMLVLPAVFGAYKAELHMAQWLPSSARHRVIIWDYTAERVPDHLWRGIGAASTPALKPKRETAEKPAGFRFPRSTGEHAHDLFLQTWYELGVIGVILVAYAGAATAIGIYLLPSVAVPFASAAFFVCVAIETFAWSVWQMWLMCAVGLLVIYLQVAAQCHGLLHRTLALRSEHQSKRIQKTTQVRM
jgi:O-antigen ligase